MNQKIDIDFHISSTLELLKVSDMSLWALIVDKPAVIEITTPGESKPIKEYFDKKMVNTFSSISLDISCGENRINLPDGIYKVTLIGSPSKYKKTRYYLKTDNLQNDLDEIYIRSLEEDRTLSREIQDSMTYIEFLVKGAEAYLRRMMKEEASVVFETAMKQVERLQKRRKK